MNSQNSQFSDVQELSGQNVDNGEEVMDDLITTLREILVKPPLRNLPLPTEAHAESGSKRSKRKSKFSKEQDEMIVDLKKKGKSWVDIAHITGVGSFLAARNRYQVLMGQQGVTSTVWGEEDIRTLQNLVDEGELEKWRFISREMYKLTGKFFTDAQCRELVRQLFLQNPNEFGVSEEIVRELTEESTTQNTGQS